MMSAAAAYDFFTTLTNHFTEDMCRNVQPTINNYAPSTASFFRGKLIEAYRADNQLFQNINSVAKYFFPGIAALALLTSGPLTAVTYFVIGAGIQGTLLFTEKVIKEMSGNYSLGASYLDVEALRPTTYRPSTTQSSRGIWS